LNRTSIFELDAEGYVCDIEDHARVEFAVVDETQPVDIIAYFAMTNFIYDNINRMSENARLIINESRTIFTNRLDVHDAADRSNGYYRLFKISKFIDLSDKAYVVEKNEELNFRVRAEGDRCSVRLCYVDSVVDEERQKRIYPIVEGVGLEVFNGGEIYLYQQYLEGLGHLLHERVSLNVNGNYVFDIDIGAEDTVRLSRENFAYVSYVGYSYSSLAKSVPVVVLSPLVGSTVGLVQHQKKLIFMLHNSVGGKYGTSEEDLTAIEYRRTGPVTDEAMKPWSGLVEVPITNYEVDKSTWCVSHDTAEPFTLLMVTQDIQVSDDEI
jgi:hypothetical protein